MDFASALTLSDVARHAGCSREHPIAIAALGKRHEVMFLAGSLAIFWIPARMPVKQAL